MITKSELLAVTSFVLFFTLVTLVFADENGPDFVAGVGIVVNVGGSTNATGTKCGNNITSCGTWPNCKDLSVVSYCVNSHVIESYCSNNQPRNRTRTESCTPSTSFNMNATGKNGQNRQLTLTIYSPGTTSQISLVSVDGLSPVSSTIPIVDMKFDFDSSYLTILTKGVNFTKMQSKNQTFFFDKPSPSIPNYQVYKAYLVELPSDLSFTSINLKIKYSDVAGNETSFVILRCGNYNTATNTCNEAWQNKTISSIDLANKIISLDISSFSVYALASQAPQTTTTTTTQSSQPSNQESSPSSSSSSSDDSDFIPSISSSNEESETLTTSSTTPVAQTTSSTTQTAENKTEESASGFLAQLNGAIAAESMLPIYLIASTILGALYFFRSNFSKLVLYKPRVYVVRPKGRIKNYKTKTQRKRKETEITLILE